MLKKSILKGVSKLKDTLGELETKIKNTTPEGKVSLIIENVKEGLYENNNDLLIQDLQDVFKEEPGIVESYVKKINEDPDIIALKDSLSNLGKKIL
jgi:hypothetical protein